MDMPAKLPKSVSGWIDPFLLCAVTLAAYGAFSRLSISTKELSVLILATGIAVMVLLEWSRAPRSTAPYPLRESLRNTMIIWAGTLVGFAIVILAWDTLAIYRSTYFVPFFETLPFILILMPFVSFLFIFAAVRAFGPSQKGGYQLGLVAFGRVQEVDWQLVRDDVISWLIRGFFLPINFCELVWALGVFRGHELSLLGGSWVIGEYYLLIVLYAFIIAAVTPGYLFGSRRIRTETKAVSHSWFGWTVTLACYAPFEAAFFVSWFDYSPGVANPSWLQPWVLHLQQTPVALMFVGGVILFLTLIHLWGEAQFGLRSSNLSNRGIITTGPYRFCKHPVYGAKCVAWLLIWMPFASGAGLLDDVRLTVLWLGVCGIYALRALAEEELLAGDPDYTAYALWMDRHGAFRKLGEIFPPFSYAWRLAYWRAQGRAPLARST